PGHSGARAELIFPEIGKVRSYWSSWWSGWEGRRCGDKRAPDGQNRPWKRNTGCWARTAWSRRREVRAGPANRTLRRSIHEESGMSYGPALLALRNTPALLPADRMSRKHWCGRNRPARE